MVKNPSQIHTNKIEPYLGLFETESDQSYALGTLFKAPDGRLFRYAKAGGSNLSKAYMGQAPAEVANHKEIAIGTGASVGDTELTISTQLSTALTKDQYAEGTILINKGDGSPHQYRVKGNGAGGDGASDTVTVTLHEPIVTAISSTDEFTLKANPYNGVIALPTTGTGIPVGVPLVDVDAGDFYWAQVKGLAPIVVDSGDTVVIGNPVGKPGTNDDAGAVGVVGSSGTDPVYGLCATVGAAGEPAQVKLTLE